MPVVHPDLIFIPGRIKQDPDGTCTCISCCWQKIPSSAFSLSLLVPCCQSAETPTHLPSDSLSRLTWFPLSLHWLRNWCICFRISLIIVYLLCLNAWLSWQTIDRAFTIQSKSCNFRNTRSIFSETAWLWCLFHSFRLFMAQFFVLCLYFWSIMISDPCPDRAFAKAGAKLPTSGPTDAENAAMTAVLQKSYAPRYWQPSAYRV